MPHLIFILFLFALGACVGSFLNVVVWRLPRGQSLASPPSHCPKCQHRLAWHDNIPVFGWLFLRGKCRYCDQAISVRYPIVELITGLLFVFYYVMFFIFHIGPCAPEPMLVGIDRLFGRPIYANRLMEAIQVHWPIFILYLFLISSLLAISLIDADLFIIPLKMAWLLAGVGMVVHAIIDRPSLPGALNLSPHGLAAPLAAGGGLGLLLSIVLFRLGYLKESFPEGEPMELDEALYQEEIAQAQRENREPAPRPRVYTTAEIRREIGKEVLFLLPPVLGALLGLLAVRLIPSFGAAFGRAAGAYWVSGGLGAVFGALIGGLVVWLARILGTLAFGRIAMGLGDVHLMFGVGAVIGAGASVVAFFLAPFAGLAVGIYNFVARKQRELPYGPYLSLATGAVLLVYCPIAEYLAPGFAGLGLMLRGLFTG